MDKDTDIKCNETGQRISVLHEGRKIYYGFLGLR